MSARYPRAVCGLVLAAALAGVAAPARYAIAQNTTQADEPSGDSATAAAEPAGTSRKSSYTPAKETCGTAPLAFPRVRIGMRAGYCAGLVASKDDGLIFPRTIVQVPDTRYFVVADMGGWSAKQGRLLLLDPQAGEGKRIKVLMTKLDVPHGLAVGIDHRIYASTADTVFRFDPLAPQPETTVEVILQGLPGLQPTLSDGSKLERNSLHPLKHFIFDKTGRIYVNVGAPTDNCGAQAAEFESLRGWRRRDAAGVGVGIHAAGKRHFSGPEARRCKSAARSFCARPAQFDGARGASAISGCGLCLHAGRERARSARHLQAQ